jgi:hypothetical protein
MLILNVFHRFSRFLQIFLVINFAAISTSIVEVWGRALFDFYARHSLVVINYLVVLFALAYLRMRRLA